ncbi:MAG: enoyl-CoA hydratase/isomerase family protein [Betaproteobacteria bacterium]|nr:enoyl-CoA hydratase/isomerase family protein [Betaproteobacteria bacterium]
MNPPNWTLERDADGIAWLTLDCAGASTNTLSEAVRAELASRLDELLNLPPSGLVIRSGKAAGFIAGADIGEFTAVRDAAAARALVQRGWDLMNRVAALPFPTLALIRGHCMGGGLELALACRYRVVVDEPGTRLALPEVMLGIVPGWGGMARLPQAVGAPAALDMMLTGRGVSARAASRMGLADECVAPRVMENAARTLLLSGRPRHRPSWRERLPGLWPWKELLVSAARRKVGARARPGHYPAPYAILDIWAHHDGNALAVPAGQPGSLEAIVGSATAANLVRVFFLQERLKGFGKEADFAPRRVHVVGAGIMGGDIAAWCALHGLTVTLQDQDITRIAPAIARAAEQFRRRHRGDARAVQAALDRLIPDPAGDGVRQADVVIEAIFEDLEAKRRLFAGIEPRLKPGAMLATNTSSLRLEDIATALREPGRLVGIHFFNPVAKMPLVEVVSSTTTDPATAARAAAFVRRVDKLPLPVKSAPGFLVNAVLAPYLEEAMRCVDDGIAPETVDEAALAFGMPMGPIELADTVGLDIAVAAGRQLAGVGAAAPRRLTALVQAGNLGRKSGRGFYSWADGKAQKGAPGAVPEGLAQRLVTPLLAAARRCVDEGVVADADLADAGVIFGTGFAPFTGGPLHYAAVAGDGGGHAGLAAQPVSPRQRAA